ncbi:MAG: xanthine dehydrogenase family protein molybdopterin-binding subunit, partial [Gammaproteobacteria bacterium]|nr:xanthine dehydrogenase family protein molybdopterin-binding subunit [Gammaproteobacteria bacterium]
MIENGIGASVRRKEDNRFLIGKGNYTDDINIVGQTYAYFVRSPHAHAAIKNIDTGAAESASGVVAVLTGEHLAADGIGPLICGVTVTSDDGQPHRAPAHPALAQGKVHYVGDHVAVVIAESLTE